MQELPIEYIQVSVFWNRSDYYVVTLEFGKDHAAIDPFDSSRISRTSVNEAEQSAFLHPVVRRYNDSELVAEHHIIEDLESIWDEEEHVRPLQEFLARQQEIDTHLLVAGRKA